MSSDTATTSVVPYIIKNNSWVCYDPTNITTVGLWMGDMHPLLFSLPLFIVQIIVVAVTTRTLVIILRPFRQPRVLAEIIGGIVLGPSVLGKFKMFGETLFPLPSLLTLETAAHLGLLYFLFLVGVEMDVAVIRRTGRKALMIAVAGMLVPFAIGTGTASFLHKYLGEDKDIKSGTFIVFLGVALSITAFPVLARILAEIKLLNSELGKLAMSAAIVNDIFAWVMLALSIAMAESSRAEYASALVLLSGTAFVLFCFYLVRPAMWWVIQRVPEGETVDDFYVYAIIIGVMIAGTVTELIGIHSAFGAFVFGLSVPNGPLGATLIEKLEDFSTGLLLPVFFVISGLRTSLTGAHNVKGTVFLVVVFLLSSVSKVVSTMLIALYYSMPLREGLSLGFLMNTRGLVEVIVLNIGKDKQVLDDYSFAVLVFMSVIMTLMVTPVVTSVHRPAKRLAGYKRRNLQRSKPDAELRLVACVHTPRNVPSILSLLDASNPTKRSPIFVYSLHLVELTGRASAMLIVHSNSTSSSSSKTNSRMSQNQSQSDHIAAAFARYEQHAGGVSVQTITAVSPYSTMHEDITALAEDKHATLLLLPFHKHQTVSGGLEETHPAISTVNQNVLATATCSAAIFLDRGFSAPQHQGHHIALLFFGGPDDREALAYAWRMVEHPVIHLTVFRFIPGEEAAMRRSASTDSRVINIITDSETIKDREEDDEYINEFRLRTVNDDSVFYTEITVNNCEETVEALRSLERNHDLYVVGRSAGERASEMLDGMADWMENPELGPVGDFLVSADLGMSVSVLVVQQYVGKAGSGEDAFGGREAAEPPVQQYLNNAHNRGRMVAGTHKGAASGFKV